MTQVLAVPSRLHEPRVRPAPRPHGWEIHPDVIVRVMLFLVAATLAAWRLYSCGRMNLPGVLFFLVYPWTAYHLGLLVTLWLRVEAVLERSFAFRFLLGFMALAIIQFLVRSLLPGSLAAQFVIIAVLVGLAVRWFPRPASTRPGFDRDLDRQARAQVAAELFLVVLCLLAATCWSRVLLVSEDIRGDHVIYRRWIDFFEHATVVARMLAGGTLWSMGNYGLYGAPTSLYHYASYLPAATAAAFAGGSAMDAAVSTWSPLGNVLLGLAAYTLVLPWAGWRGGLCATMAVLLIPDATYYWPAGAFHRYHWLQQVGCAGPYGVAAATLSVVLLHQWKSHGNRRAFVGAGAYVLAVFWLKGQVFFVLVPLLCSLAILWWPGVSRAGRLTRFAAALALGVALAAVLIHFNVLPDFGPSRQYVEDYNHCLAIEFPEGACRRILYSTCQEMGTATYYALSIAIYAIASFGLWLPLGLMFLAGSIATRTARPHDAVPVVVVLLYLCFYACLNDYALVGVLKWELIHRPVVWAYFVLVAWCSARVYLALAAIPASRRLVRPAVLAVVALGLLPLPWRMGRCIQEGKCHFRPNCVNLVFPRGLVRCARWIARSGSRYDVVQDGQYDESLLVCGLSERRSYLAKPSSAPLQRSELIRSEIERRKEQLEAMRAMTSREQLAEFAQQSRIRWYILHPGDAVGWPADIVENPAFADRGFRVYDLQRTWKRARPDPTRMAAKARRRQA
jgi:hypothetical protein